ncbi:MAG: hypothetical protein ACRYG4_21755 [Janthinobacterium lividum]
MKYLLCALLLSAAGTAHAAGVCGAGTMATMRVSRLIPGGTVAGFNEAVHDHAAWYASHGLKDDSFVTAPTVTPGRGSTTLSTTTFVTIHVYGSGEPKHDAAWDAYVGKYRANSTIASEARFCLPKGAAIAAR